MHGGPNRVTASSWSAAE